MGVSGGTELSTQVASGTFTATGPGTSANMVGPFNISLWGTFVGRVALERSFDGGTTFIQVTFPDGTPIVYQAAAAGSWGEIEPGVFYRLRCSAFTSGVVNWRISR